MSYFYQNRNVRFYVTASKGGFFLFGAGGFAGIYLGARCQKFVPQKPIKILLGVLIIFVALKYVIQYFR